MKALICGIMFLLTLPIWSQKDLTLQECYELVSKNYPLVRQVQLLEDQHHLNLETISIEKLPQLVMSAQATYQSDVIEVPIPNSGIKPLNKDQYRATLSLNQLIYNGGLTDASSNLKSAQLETNKKKVEVSLYQLKKEVNQLYFSILFSKEKLNLLTAKKLEIESKLNEIKSGISNGILVPTSDKVLEVELLKIKQQISETKSNTSTLIPNLSALIAVPLDESTKFHDPMIELDFNSGLNRPEMDLFQLKKEEIESSESLMAKQRTPKLMGFATGGYGNPGLNMLDNSFQAYYIFGLKLDWNVLDWNANKKQREVLAINKEVIDTDSEVFKLNTIIELQQQKANIHAIENLINTDQEIINLRSEVLKSAETQLKNGVITTSDYVTELTNFYEDKNNLAVHTIQLQLAKANYNVIQGQ